MFKNLLKELKPVIPRLESNLFDKDTVFNNEEILNRGIYKESLQEDLDGIVLTKEFISSDKTFSKIQITKMDKSSFFIQVNHDLINLPEARKEIACIKSKINDLVEENKFEECTILRDKMYILNKIVEIKTT